jgi:hypothetical protein
MLRKSLVSTLILLYSASAIGLPLHFHYCRGELKHITLLVKMECHAQEHDTMDHACCRAQKSQCDLGIKTQNCCDDATQWIQEDLPALCVEGHDLEFPVIANAAVTSSVELFQHLYSGVSIFSVKENPGTGPPIYQIQCSLIYYG